MKKYQVLHLNSMLIDDAHLDLIVKEIVSFFPKCGEKTVNGRLKSCGIRVPRQRIRESLERVDPTGLVGRCQRLLCRSKYKVASPNSLWHLD